MPNYIYQILDEKEDELREDISSRNLDESQRSALERALDSNLALI